ncbi:Gp37-like protein [Modestobacter sp. VKM Ac-2985]|uniref:Gp37-like protein n=1 Tax=Modestobacter sp. VKM Ac-2985 TaxID=3004139 RepID=UPI0022AB9090|nr:hypothetical protein [Modestobacter sp. VKM Ac-2985]MCZ2837133.1 hypothetical protein [Modestobacter sp. VKM Ac-2985]
MSDWQIHPRNANLSRSYDPVSGWSSLVLVERYGPPDSWTITGPASALSVFQPGMGCILDRDGEQITSGQVAGINRSGAVVDNRSVETMTLAFTSDLGPLGDRIVRPTPSQALSAAISTFPAAYDLRTGTVEALILGYVNGHIGPGALADRRLSRLRLPASLGRGGTTQVSGRLDNLGVLVTSLAEAGNLRVNVRHTEDVDGAWLDLTIDAIRDLSNDVRFGTADTTAAGLITEWDYDLSRPTSTRPMVGLGGELAAREFLELRDTAAEALWSAVVETFVDQRSVDPDSTDKLAEATRAGQEARDAGKGPTRVAFVPTLGPDLEYRRDVRVGDIVGYDLPGLDPAADKIREATTTVTVEQGQATERVAVVIGTPDAPATRTQQQTARALRAVTAIQRST